MKFGWRKRKPPEAAGGGPAAAASRPAQSTAGKPKLGRGCIIGATLLTGLFLFLYYALLNIPDDEGGWAAALMPGLAVMPWLSIGSFLLGREKPISYRARALLTMPTGALALATVVVAVRFRDLGLPAPMWSIMATLAVAALAMAVGSAWRNRRWGKIPTVNVVWALLAGGMAAGIYLAGFNRAAFTLPALGVLSFAGLTLLSFNLGQWAADFAQVSRRAAGRLGAAGRRRRRVAAGAAPPPSSFAAAFAEARGRRGGGSGGRGSNSNSGGGGRRGKRGGGRGRGPGGGPAWKRGGRK